MSAPIESVVPAYRIDGAPVGPDAFYAVACDPRRHVVVEACAGAGKTWMLVSRILLALLEGAQPQEILAITFTRKAAGEMRSRLAQWLTELSADGGSDAQRIDALQQRGLDAATARALAPTLAGLQQRLQQAGRSVEIRTFHAWFSQLLKAAPLDLLTELGVQRDAQIVEDIADHESEVFRRFHGVVVADETLRADYHHLVQRHGRSQLRKWLDAAWSKRVEIELADAAGTLEPSVAAPASPCPDVDEAAQPTQWVRSSLVRQTMQRCASVLGASGKAKAAEAARAIEAALSMGALPTADDAAVFEALWAALHTQKDTPRKGLGDRPEQQAAIDLLLALRDALAQHEARDEHLRMVRLSRVLFAELAAYKRSRGLVEMADLERCAVALLGDSTLSGWVQERLDARVRHLLIDEFQDTSPLQWHALAAWLSGYAGAGGGASGQRPPSVFIVGDPKQSIYRFRRAEPKVFEAARDFVQHGLGGQVLSCDHTRRNAPEVLAVLNAVFSQAGRDGEFAGFRPHSTALGPVSGAGVRRLPPVLREPRDRDGEALSGNDVDTWRDTLTVPRVEPEQALRQQEADRVALAVREVLAGGVAPGEIQVLCRKRESLRLAAGSLAALGVPCAAVEEAQLFDAPEVRDLIAVLDVLASPSHALSLAQALKSPIFGCSDDDLVQLASAVAEAAIREATADAGDLPSSDGAGVSPPIATTRRRAVPLGWWKALHSLADPSSSLLRARELLRDWQRAAGVLPPHDLLDRIVDEGQVIERTLAAVPPTRRAAARASIDALLAQSLMLDGARGATPYNFVRALRRRRLKIVSPAQPDAVQLLTIHGAKGLEAEVVFVMDTQPEPTAADTATLLVQWLVDSPHPVCCAFIYAESQCPPSLRPLFEAEQAARRREELNGLYVSMTRAKHRVVFSATVPHRAPAAASWWQRLEPHAVAWSPGSAGQRAPGTPIPDLRLRVLPVWPAIAAPAIAQADNNPVGDKGDGGEASRLGQAVHRVLEWSVRCAPPLNDSLDKLCAAAAREFGAEVSPVQRVAAAILSSPACQHFFDASRLIWSGNEVSVVDGGEVLRIDRLVHVGAAGGKAGEDEPPVGVWWVLDYKLSHAPQQLDVHRQQLRRYQRAVSRLQPGAIVRCAFITGSGAVIELT
ncbi:MAG: UvrD-helicase domain-containing protein [Pseudomonadota bacterium]|nr:UvrD-helicase domain-containing protein [Pseudomonadota bacterium]